MITVPFRKQYDKLVQAYLRNEVNPYIACGCFVGNLLNKQKGWSRTHERFTHGLWKDKNYPSYMSKQYYTQEWRKEALSCIRVQGKDTYTPKDIAIIEDVFMRTYDPTNDIDNRDKSEPIDEGRLFSAFEAALLKLREIHELKGEVIEDYTFTKRVLEPVSI